jgi:hypothetical protein
MTNQTTKEQETGLTIGERFRKTIGYIGMGIAGIGMIGAFASFPTMMMRGMNTNDFLYKNPSVRYVEQLKLEDETLKRAFNRGEITQQELSKRLDSSQELTKSIYQREPNLDDKLNDYQSQLRYNTYASSMFPCSLGIVVLGILVAGLSEYRRK